MSKKVRVILLEDISPLGIAGDIISVSEGYARNALFPAGRAALATDEHVARATKKKQSAQAQKEEELRQLQEQAQMIDGTELTILARAKEESEEIYGKITGREVAKELKSQANLHVEAKDIVLEGPITAIGSYEATVGFGDGIEATVHIVVKKEE